MEHTGQINVYICQSCGKKHFTVNGNDGTTPFMIGCYLTKECPGPSQSQFYRLDPADSKAKSEFEFYRPLTEECKGLSEAERDYVERGCLMLRRVGTYRRLD